MSDELLIPRVQIEKQLSELRKVLAEIEQRQAQLRDQRIAVRGGIQSLETLLAPKPVGKPE